MITFTSTQAQRRFGRLLDSMPCGPVAITRRGRAVAVLVALEGDRAVLATARASDAFASAAGRRAIAAFRGAGKGGTVTQLLADRRADA